MAGFTLRGHLLGADNPVVTEMIIANSQTVTVGDAVKASSGYVLLDLQFRARPRPLVRTAAGGYGTPQGRGCHYRRRHRRGA